MDLKWPQPVTALHTISFKFNPDISPFKFLSDCKEEWTQSTGVHPDRDPTHTQVYRAAVLTGCPDKVKARMIENPDIAGARPAAWENHLVHHLKLSKDMADKNEGAGKDIEVQLLKFQLEEARKTAVQASKTNASTVNIWCNSIRR